MTFHNSSPEFYAAAEAADEAAREAFGDDYADHETPERFVPEADYNAATPQEWADLQTVLDWERFEGFGS